MVRAKLKLRSIEEDHYRQKTLRFSAEYDSTIPEDRRFQQPTPTASPESRIDNPPPLEQSKPGDTYYVDFTPGPKPGS